MRVLIIGDLAGELGNAARIAITRGASLIQADGIDAALARLRADGRVDLVLCDLAHDIAALARALTTERIAAGIVACGVDADPAAAARAIRDGAREFLPLPPDPDLIAAILLAASGESHLLIARDPLMLDLLHQVERIATADVSILIGGESGTGKEVLARHIHRRSRRAGGPFVALNCAALPEALLESELFGHEKGAFSGALARRIGKFEAAEGGTLLLDEIGELDIHLQAKLLRAIQEREIDRLGGTAPVRVDVRILAATNRDLPAEIAAGRFREDLYFRLNVVALRIPPLRERPADIVALATHFVAHFSTLNGLPPRHLSDTAIARLRSHPWRGNVRELENTLHRAVLLANTPLIDADAIATTPAAPTPTPTPTGLAGRSMAEVERTLILDTLGHTLGNRTHAAAILGISIRTLRNKLRDYTAQGIAVPAADATLTAA